MTRIITYYNNPCIKSDMFNMIGGVEFIYFKI